MKKLTVFVISLLLLGMLLACGKKQVAEPSDAPVDVQKTIEEIELVNPT